MGIFNFNDPKNNANQAGGPMKINLPPNILASLNLTAQDIETYQTEAIEKESREAGVNYYKDNSDNIAQAPPIKLGEIALSAKVENKSDVVESLYTQMDTMEGAMEQTLKPDSLKLIKAHLQAFSAGWAQAAMAANDWQTAIKSLDKITEGGIVQKTDVISTLGNTYRDDLGTRVKIAELVQELVNKRGQTTSQEPPKAPGPTLASALTDNAPDTRSAEPAPAPPAPQPAPTPIPEPRPTTPSTLVDSGQATSQPLANLKPESPNDIPLTPKINLAQGKPTAPITTDDGVILRPVPVQNPTNLTS